jgi:hypothetical protein
MEIRRLANVIDSDDGTYIAVDAGLYNFTTPPTLLCRLRNTHNGDFNRFDKPGSRSMCTVRHKWENIIDCARERNYG